MLFPFGPGLPTTPARLFIILARVPKTTSYPWMSTKHRTAGSGRGSLSNATPQQRDSWILRLISCQFLNTDPHFFCRSLWCKKDDYIEFLKTTPDEAGNIISDSERKILEGLPSGFWVTEVSLPNLFSGNKRKIGDIICTSDPQASANAKGEISKLVLFAWMPGLAWHGGGFTNPLPDWSLKGHLPLMRTYLTPKTAEW